MTTVNSPVGKQNTISMDLNTTSSKFQIIVYSVVKWLT